MANESKEATQETSEVIEMSDGRKTTFAGKRRMIQTPIFKNGDWEGMRVDFRFPVSDAYPENTIWLPRPDPDAKVSVGGEQRSARAVYEAYGCKQKNGDFVTTVKPGTDKEAAAEDMFDAVKAGTDRFYKEGIWSDRREASGLAGTSVLVRAMVAMSKANGTGKNAADAKEAIRGLTPKGKLELRSSAKLKPFVDEVEAAIAARSKKAQPKVDSDAVLKGF